MTHYSSQKKYCFQNPFVTFVEMYKMNMLEFKLGLSLPLLILGLLTASVQMKAQNRFEGALVLGLNASQIDGDQLAGYDKLGLTGGVKLDYALNLPWYLSMELIYSQRGSQTELVPGGTIPLRKINLQYIEIPLLVRYKDWWVDTDDYYKVDVEMGLSYGYMFRSNSSVGGFSWETEDFAKNDVSFVIGANYFINKHWGFGARYTKSFTRLYIDPDTKEKDLLGYFLSFRAYFQF
jgi:hypothetical protein